MKGSEYQKLAARTECNQVKSRDRILYLDVINPDPSTLAVRLNHSVIGLAGEVGELASLIQKWIYYGKWDGKDKDDLRALLIEEYGDALWYIALGLNALGVSMDEVMEGNIRKLQVRYPEKYTDYHADDTNRDRQAELQATVQNIPPALAAYVEKATVTKQTYAADPSDPVTPVTKHWLAQLRHLFPPGGLTEDQQRFLYGEDRVVQDGHGFGHVEGKTRAESEAALLSMNREQLLWELDSCFCDSHDGPTPDVECNRCKKIRELLATKPS